MGTGLKITVGVLLTVFLLMFGYRTWYTISAIREVPLIGIVCSSDGDVPRVLSNKLEALGYTPNGDFRFSLFPCTSPNTPRQAATLVTGENAQYLIVMLPEGLQEAQSTKIPTLDAHELTATQITQKLADWLASRTAKSTGPGR